MSAGPGIGDLVRVRSRQYLVEDVIPAAGPGESTLVRLSCLEDDARGEPLEVLWEKEIDSRVVNGGGWQALARRGFASPRACSAYLHTLRWRCVTSTNPRLFQAPYRAGIEVKAYQLEPLRKALLMPRVNLFIADDVGLGKTIEAGLILRELLLRQKVRRTVICCPPSVVLQWQEEMEQRFGLSFVIYDRSFVTTCRQERGFAVNPWTTHNRFIISQALIRNESYAGPLRDWLGTFSGGAMLILDEAHNAAPASGARYAIDSKLTRTIRDLAPRFEHKLFLSATPHNGHSNSFSAMLEMLDPQRFCRGVPVHHATRDLVMVRRLKHDLREIGEEFPERKIIRIELDGLPEDAPELQLSRFLQQYRRLREQRLRDATRAQQAAAMLVVTSLQKRLLSSIEAFARTLKVHRDSLTRATEKDEQVAPESLLLLMQAPGSDDERAALAEEEVQAEEDVQMAAASRAGGGPAAAMAAELAVLAEMAAVADHARYQQDAKLRHLLGWIKSELVPELGSRGAQWRERRLLIFTEYTDTKRYLEQILQTAITGSDRDSERIMSFHGGIGEERREQIKAAFNADPKSHPLRILIATDAAREGVNLQNHCADLFHFDIPWNPGRMEQRNGRIDRKLQRAKEVRCHYYVLPQRAEDRVLEVLVAKTTRIQSELGSLSPVVERRLDSVLAGGISDQQEGRLVSAIATASNEAHSGRCRVIAEELEEVRERRSSLIRQVEHLEQMLRTSREWIGLDDHHFREALSVSLEMLGAGAIEPLDAAEAARDPATARWQIPALDERVGADPTWAATLDTLRAPRPRGEKEWQWRRQAPLRPVVFRDPGSLDGEVVHLHLEHRVVQRLLARLHSQGFLSQQLTRACIVRCDDPVPRVLVLGRLSLYGDGAARLHDEIIAVAAEWQDPEQRGRASLRPLGEGDKAEVMHLLEAALAQGHRQQVPELLQQRLQATAEQDISQLQPHVQRRADALAERAARDLERRGEQEARSMQKILERQQERIRRTQSQIEGKPQQLELFSQDEMRQLNADQRHWAARLEALALELVEEPQRIRNGYQVRAQRIEPVGLIYLWPRSS